MLRAACADGAFVATAASPVAAGVPVDPETFPIKVIPYPVLDVGDRTIGASVRGVIRLVNTGDRPVLLAECTTNCQRMVTNCPRDRQLEPGEEIEVEVSKSRSPRSGVRDIHTTNTPGSGSTSRTSRS
jgi:hypothetical protein